MTRPPLTRLQRVALVVLPIVLSLRALLFLVQMQNSRHPTAQPHWPPEPGAVIAIKPGDPNIVAWGANPEHDGFVVGLVTKDGNAPDPPRACALMPEYMGDAAQPGGTLRLLSQTPTGDWQVQWQGGATIPPLASKSTYDGNCGHSAVVTMSASQLHNLINMTLGLPDAAAGPDKPPPIAIPDPSPAGR